tara:strand:- start:3501 stop:3968 length:468 start_codon:yes stop_codon:yes gene_type:complete
MPITINGSGTVTGISAGGLPDAIITAPELSGAQTGSAPIYGCRAWVNFDGTRNEADTGASTNGANVKIRASGNVTSVLKNAVGDYTVTFTTAMPDANYAAVGTANLSSLTTANTAITFNLSGTGTTPQAASAFRIWAKQAGTLIDCDFVNVTIFR